MARTLSGVFTLLLLLFCFLLAACDYFSNSDAALKHRLSDTENKLAKAEGDLFALQATVNRLKGSKDRDDLIKDSDKVAYLTPGAEGYSTVGFDLGVLTMQLENVKPYANGSKVTLRFGNILSSAISGLNAKIDWVKSTIRELRATALQNRKT